MSQAAFLRALAQVFTNNSIGVTRFLPQMLDVFQVAAAVLGLIALLAFTPGERLERTVRALIFTLVGFMVGASVALAVVAVGFGGYVKPRSYFGYIADGDIHDGDTLRIGEVSLRLFGADALELDQSCPNDPLCGSRARERLVELTSGNLIQCDQQLSQRNRRPRDSFGRALVTCWVVSPVEDRVDLAARMIEEGFAVQYEGRQYGYSAEEAVATQAGANIWGGCNLRPDHWRNRDSRRAFLAHENLPDDAELVGPCAAQ